MANAIILEPMAMSSITASATAAGYSASNMGTDYMGLVWNSGTGSSTRSVTIDLGSDKAVDTIALFGLAGATSAWDWSIDLATAAQGAFSGSFYSDSSADLLAGSVMPVSGLGKALWQAPGGAPALSRYVRINFSNLSSAAVQVARVVIADKVSLTQNFRFGAVQGIQPRGLVEFSIRGVLMRRSGVKQRLLGISYANATRVEVEASILPLMERNGNDTPFCIVTDPATDTQRQNRMYFGFLTGQLGTVWARQDGFEATFSLVALA